MTTPEKVYDPYAEMVKHADSDGRLWVVWPDMVTNGRTRPSREQLLADVMSIPSYSCYRSATGEAVWERREITMEMAVKMIGGYGLPREEAAA